MSAPSAKPALHSPEKEQQHANDNNEEKTTDEVPLTTVTATLFVKASDKTLTLTVTPSHTVESVKQKVQEQLGIAPQSQELTFNSKKLTDDQQQLQQLGIDNGDTLELANPDSVATGAAPKQLEIRSLTGRAFTVDVGPTDTIIDVMRKIQAKEGVPADQQRLVHKGKWYSFVRPDRQDPHYGFIVVRHPTPALGGAMVPRRFANAEEKAELERKFEQATEQWRESREKTLAELGIQDKDMMHLVLRLRGGCIASPVPATFGSHCHTPGVDLLSSANTVWSEETERSASLASQLGGPAALSDAAQPACHPTAALLTPAQCHALMAFADKHLHKHMQSVKLDGHQQHLPEQKALHPQRDFRMSLTRRQLLDAIGHSAVRRLEAKFGGPYDTIRLRRAEARGRDKGDSLVPFHTDYSRRTMQVALNSDSEYTGGRLVFATAQGFVVPRRPAGSCTVHTHLSVHGVTSLRQGVRYGLFLCNTAQKQQCPPSLSSQPSVPELTELTYFLAARVLEQPQFFARALAFLRGASDSDLLRVVQDEYIPWVRSEPGVGADPPHSDKQRLAVLVVWRTHMLMPLHYARARQSGSGIKASLCDTFAQELVSAVRRQQAFMAKVLGPLRRSIAAVDVADGTITDIVQQYLCFLRAAAGECAGHQQQQQQQHPAHLEPPSLLVDLVWHVHQQSPARYTRDCHALCGVFVNHQF